MYPRRAALADSDRPFTAGSSPPRMSHLATVYQTLSLPLYNPPSSLTYPPPSPPFSDVAVSRAYEAGFLNSDGRQNGPHGYYRGHRFRESPGVDGIGPGSSKHQHDPSGELTDTNLSIQAETVSSRQLSLTHNAAKYGK